VFKSLRRHQTSHVNNMTEHIVEGFRELEAVTFDHYNTLQHSATENQEDIIYPIIRSLETRIDLNEERFIEEYVEQDKRYRRNERETFIETTIDELILNALIDSGHGCPGLPAKVTASVDQGLRTRRLAWYPDAEEVLLRLRGLGYRLGLISNTHWRLLPERRRELTRFFDVITLSYEHGYAKPHPSIFNATAMRLGAEPRRCLHVGDDPVADVWGARNAGMRAVYVKRNGLEAEDDVVIQRLTELTPYIDK
jgi:HAD superfamily hydrolase (TIGR01509 family)